MLIIKIKWAVKTNHSLVQIHRRSLIRRDSEVHKVVKDRCVVHRCIRDCIKVHLRSRGRWRLWMSMKAHNLTGEWAMIWRTGEAAASHLEWWHVHHQTSCPEDSIKWCWTDRKLKQESTELLQYKGLARHNSTGTQQENKDSAKEKQAAAATAVETTANSCMKEAWEEKKKSKRYNKEPSPSKTGKRSRITHSSHKSIQCRKTCAVSIMRSPRIS